MPRSIGRTTVDVGPAPGRGYPTDVVYYDNNTELLFSGDFLMPGRLLIDNADLYLASSRRVADFVRQRPVRYVLGGHIELDSSGQTLPWQSRITQTNALCLYKDDVLALPAAIEQFNGFYSSSGHFIMMNSIRILKLSAVLAVAITIAIIVAVVVFVRRWRRRRRAAALTPAA